MFEIKHIVKIPQQAEIRNSLRQRARLLVSGQNLYPPSTLENLEKFARQIMQSSGLSKEYLNFIIVLLGNEIWRETVAAIPYSRRLLLLPQCLRNDQQCQGNFDDLGLICAGCKNCNIHSVIDKAEKLGYTTLVAEGTSVAIGLVEEGSIDAVIGVSCLPVLQRSFKPVTNAAVPGIGIPLLGDGCSNTEVDYKWLFEELENFNGVSNNTPLSVSLLKNQIVDYFRPPIINSFFDSDNETEQLSLEVLGKGGQRIRPLLTVMAYLSYSINPLEEVQKSLAMVIECFHKASLVHDDIEDDDEIRYGQPVLHKTHGIPVAINVGDWLIGKGYSLLSQISLTPYVLAECLNIVAKSHVRLSEGQGADILLSSQITEKSVEDVLKIFRLKTGEAVKVALLTGAIAGEAEQLEKAVLNRFSEFFGVAYQIRDDLMEYREQNPAGSLFDYPFLLSLLLQDMQIQNQELRLMLEKQDVGLFRTNCSRYKIDNKAEGYLLEYVGKCYSELDNLQNVKMRLALYGLVGKLFKM